MDRDLITINKATEWASNYLQKSVTKSNITYLINYGKIRKYTSKNQVLIDKNELKEYYARTTSKRKKEWSEKIGEGLNWELSLSNFPERERTKHVHKLHPYKGKYVPQLVEYFLDDHINEFKTDQYFYQNDIVIDPFVGSGTTLVQALELGIHSIGVDISEFNCLISRTKVAKYDTTAIEIKLKEILRKIRSFSESNFDNSYFKEMGSKILNFNREHFPAPEIRRKMSSGEVDEKEYSTEKVKLFFNQYPEYKQSIQNKIIETKQVTLDNFTITNLESIKFEIDETQEFFSKWFGKQIQYELNYFKKLILEEEDTILRSLLQVILTRTARSCRATTHIDLGTLKEPVFTPYYCRKHRKICKPTNTILSLLSRYILDAIRRIEEFSSLKQNVHSEILHGDSRFIDILTETNLVNPDLHQLLKTRKADGIFTSPPYVGQIDYHEQHAYAYELLDLERRDEVEIGPQFMGESIKAKEEYVQGISDVLKNMMKFLKEKAEIFVVANDKYTLYPRIAELSNLKIEQEFIRPVLHRTEADNSSYSEKIFRMRRIDL